MCRTDPAVHSHAHLVAEKWAPGNSAQMREIGRHQCRGDDPALFIPFPTSKKEQPVAAERTSRSETKLTPLKERIGICCIAFERRVSGEVVIAEKIESGSMKIISTRTRNDVDCGTIRKAGREVEVHSRDLELLHDFLGQTHG